MNAYTLKVAELAAFVDVKCSSVQGESTINIKAIKSMTEIWNYMRELYNKYERGEDFHIRK